MNLQQQVLTLPEQRAVSEKQFWAWFGIILGLFVLFVASVAATGWYSFDYGRDVERELQRTRAVLTPKSVPVNPAMAQWSCTKQEAREYINACTSRKRMEGVKERGSM